LTNFYLFDGSDPSVGMLTPSQPQAPSEMSRSFVFDPSHPVPSTGGSNLEIACGPQDQRPIESRSDVVSGWLIL
jgi:predicted acyl esterase